MDALITLLVIACIVACFVAMVRRTNARGGELETLQSTKPKLLTPQQRKALKLQERKPRTAPPSPKVIEPKPSRPRAIRTGWSKGVVAFTYEDAEGDISHRTVTVHSINSIYLKGECHCKKAERTFRLDRIVGDITDCTTGEILTP